MTNPVSVPRVLADVCDVCEGVTMGLTGESKWCCYCGAKLTGRTIAAPSQDDVRGAERYRFIRDSDELPMNLMRLEMMGELLDNAIDAAIAHQHEQEKGDE